MEALDGRSSLPSNEKDACVAGETNRASRCRRLGNGASGQVANTKLTQLRRKRKKVEGRVSCTTLRRNFSVTMRALDGEKKVVERKFRSSWCIVSSPDLVSFSGQVDYDTVRDRPLRVRATIIGDRRILERETRRNPTSMMLARGWDSNREKAKARDESGSFSSRENSRVADGIVAITPARRFPLSKRRDFFSRENRWSHSGRTNCSSFYFYIMLEEQRRDHLYKILSKFDTRFPRDLTSTDSQPCPDIEVFFSTSTFFDQTPRSLCREVARCIGGKLRRGKVGPGWILRT